MLAPSSLLTRKSLTVRTKHTKVSHQVLHRPPVIRSSFNHLSSLATHHQRIVKLDRENEVAPPPKILPSVGKVRVQPIRPHDCLLTHPFHPLDYVVGRFRLSELLVSISSYHKRTLRRKSMRSRVFYRITNQGRPFPTPRSSVSSSEFWASS